MKHIAKSLLKIEAVALRPSEPFTWTSGIKSPIYCDNRLTMSYPVIRREIAQGLADIIKDYYPDTEVVAGTATAGIPHAAWVAELLDLPMVYVRGSAKKHGKQNQIEGRLTEGQKVVVIEDLISTGGSVIEASEAIQAQGGTVLGVAAIFSYELEKGRQMMQSNELVYHTLTNYDELIDVAAQENYVQTTDIDILKEWKQNPAEWKK